MGRLSQKMICDMAIRGLKPTTQKLYLSAVVALYKFHKTSPEYLTDDHIQCFIYHMVRRKLAWGTISAYVSALRFFYGKTLKHNLDQFIIPCPKRCKTLPEIFSREEVRQLMELMPNIQQETYFKILYDTGLRGNEAVHLRMCDIDRGNKRLWVRFGKGGKDRGVFLSPKILTTLERYWKAFQFDDWIFPSSRNRQQPMSRDRALRWFHALKVKGAITKKGGLHMWRHTCATHMLENGRSLRTIQKALGHSSISSTMIYLQLAQEPNEEVSLLDNLYDQGN